MNHPTLQNSTAETVANEPPYSAGEQLAELMADLQDRDELIRALTSQLEQAAEQLDRLQREGNAPRSSRSSSSMAGEFVEEQRLVNDRLMQFLELWDSHQPLNMLARIEERIEQVKAHPAPGSDSRSRTDSFGFDTGSQSASDSFQTEPSPPTSSFLGEGCNAWEQAKQKLLGQYEEPASASREPAQPELPPLEPADFDYPTPVNPECDDYHSLHDAIETRNRYIALLSQRLRGLELQAPADWSRLNNAPQELVARLQELELAYQAQLRREECELSLERARLAREEARLRQDRHRLEQQARKLGFTSDEFKLPPEPAATEIEDRSWRKMFGRRK